MFNADIQIMAPIWGPGNRGKKELEDYGCSKALHNVNGTSSTISTIPRRPFRAFWAVPKGTPKDEMLKLVVSTRLYFFSPPTGRMSLIVK